MNEYMGFLIICFIAITSIPIITIIYMIWEYKKKEQEFEREKWYFELQPRAIKKNKQQEAE